jgi:hypothetical protein
MIKLSIDLLMDEGAGVLVSQEGLKELTFSCQKVLEGLGQLAPLVEVFRVTWVNYGKGFGPIVIVYFHDPMGGKCSHQTDYRFMGNHSPNPTADDIAKALLSDLPRLIEERVNASKTKLAEVQRTFKSLKSGSKVKLTLPGVLHDGA